MYAYNEYVCAYIMEEATEATQQMITKVLKLQSSHVRDTKNRPKIKRSLTV